jgi:Cytidylyltransferase-like
LITGAYPGTFDPPTVAHIAIAEAARRQGGLDRVDLVVSRDPLGKDPALPTLAHRTAVLEDVASTRPWLGVKLTDKRLIAEVVEGYDAVVMGLDKWCQVCDPAWYGGSESARDRAVASLPRLLLAARAGYEMEGPLPEGSVVLDLGAAHHGVSSSAVRDGRRDLMLPEASAFDEATGAWSDPDRYAAYLAESAESAAPSGSVPSDPLPGSPPD